MMKKLAITLFCAALLAWSLPGRAAMSLSEIRRNARFLSDRMAYELSLNSIQYGDVYEINYDFLYGVRLVMDGVVRGNESSIDRYYEYLDMRNEDLSYVLSRRQYLEFAGKEYFYRPIYTDRNMWRLKIYGVYSNVTYFYFSIPVNFYTYNGIHSRSRYHGGYYRGRYHHNLYHGPLCHIRNHKAYDDYRWHDFRVSSRLDRKPSRYVPVRPGRYDHPDKNPGISNRPNQNDRLDKGHSSSRGSNRPNNGVRPSKSRPRQVSPAGTSRSDGEKKGTVVFNHDAKRNRSGASRR